jgi:hypothetical protein
MNHQKATKMSVHMYSADHFSHSSTPKGLGRLGAIGKQFLNILSNASVRADSRRRFANLSRRDLEDIGMTPAERDDALR